MMAGADDILVSSDWELCVTHFTRILRSTCICE